MARQSVVAGAAERLKLFTAETQRGKAEPSTNAGADTFSFRAVYKGKK
jgi:hypothetical protein